MIRRVALMLAGLAAGTLASCGSENAGAPNSLPAVVTTTTTTTTVATTTTIPEIYTVQRGDILSEIVKKFRVSMTETMAINGITNPDKIFAGQKLKIPRSSASTTTASTTTSTTVTTNTDADGMTASSTGTTVNP